MNCGRNLVNDLSSFEWDGDLCARHLPHWNSDWSFPDVLQSTEWFMAYSDTCFISLFFINRKIFNTGMLSSSIFNFLGRCHVGPYSTYKDLIFYDPTERFMAYSDVCFIPLFFISCKNFNTSMLGSSTFLVNVKRVLFCLWWL